MGYIYKITNNINDKCYIGQTQNIKLRFYEHIKNHQNQLMTRNHPKLYNAMRKYGIENFSFDVILQDVDNLEIDIWERIYIIFYDSKDNGYNCTDGGHTMLGKVHREETKIKISNSLKGRQFSEESRLKMSKWQSSKKLSNYTKSKISDALVGNNWNYGHQNRSRQKYEYTFKSNDGSIFKTNSLVLFARENNLHPGCLYDLSIGRQHIHKGWTCVSRDKISNLIK
jgi:group I intron endonuclease